MYCIVQSNREMISSAQCCRSVSSNCFDSVRSGLWSVRIVNVVPESIGVKCCNAEEIARSSLSKVE